MVQTFAGPKIADADTQVNDHQRLNQQGRENRELRRANEILRKSAAFFAQVELDRKPK